MNLRANDFELFDLPVRFEQTVADIDTRWKALQRQAHPDRSMARGDAAQRLAMQWSLRINEAYRRLSDPLRRAAYLCELHGVPVETRDGALLAPDVLEQQMHWHEVLENGPTEAELTRLEADVRVAAHEQQRACARLLDQEHDGRGAAACVRAWMFTRRLAQQIADVRAARIDASSGLAGDRTVDGEPRASAVR